jgi:hypothetical protein
VAHVRQGPRPLRRFSRNTKPRSRQRRSRLLRSRRNRGRVRQPRLSRSKRSRRRFSRDRNRRPAAKPQTVRLSRSLVLHRRRPRRLPVRGQPQVRYPFGIRRRHQHLNKASGRGWGLVGRPSGLTAMWQRRLRSNLEFLPPSRRQPHPVGRMRRLRRHVRALRPVSRLVRRCSRGRRLEPRLGISLRHLRLRVLQRLLLWWLQPPPRPVSRRQQDIPARHQQRPAVLANRPDSLERHPLYQPVLGSRPAVRPPVDQLVPRPPLLPDRKRVRPPDRPLLPQGRRARRCSHRRRCQSRYRGRYRGRYRARCLNRSSGTP